MQKRKEDDFYEIGVGIYGDACEITSFSGGSGHTLSFVLDRGVNGYITIDSLVTTIKDGRGRFDTRLLERGEYTPRLVTEGHVYEMPKIRRAERGITIPSPDDSYIRGVSIRERTLESKVARLENMINELCDSVYGKTIF